MSQQVSFSQQVFNTTVEQIKQRLAPEGFTERARVMVAIRPRELSMSDITDVCGIVRHQMNYHRQSTIEHIKQQLENTKVEKSKQNILLQLKQVNWWTRLWYRTEIRSIREALIALESQAYAFEKAILILNR